MKRDTPNVIAEVVRPSAYSASERPDGRDKPGHDAWACDSHSIDRGYEHSDLTLYFSGEKAAGTTSMFSCFSRAPGGEPGGHTPFDTASARMRERSPASL